ncbi:Hypothetical_protein [Hexamita inflata]|uniref:Hypothetical_protein n=1 Tax=Hexamita inflata TaxID=28002 RepID=A0AA86TZP8_9EUKA|nr:Hypothetical protein HINF_LOCUS20717 [Hexamita inflata]
MNRNQQIEEVMIKEYQKAIHQIKYNNALKQLKSRVVKQKQKSKSIEDLEHHTSMYRSAIYHMSFVYNCIDIDLESILQLSHQQIISMISGLRPELNKYFFRFIEANECQELNYTEKYLRSFFINTYCAQINQQPLQSKYLDRQDKLPRKQRIQRDSVVK